MADSQLLSVYLMTFNCGRTLINPTAFAPHLFTALDKSTPSSATGSRLVDTSNSNAAQSRAPPPALVVLNLQEVAPIAYAFLGGSFLKPYFDQFRSLVDIAAKARFSDSVVTSQSNYVNVITRNNGLTAIMVFVRADLIGQIGGLMTAEVGVGVQEMGNKGAVGVRLSWRVDDDHRADGSDSDDDDDEDDVDRLREMLNLTFVSAHLAPMEEDLERRNQDYKEIVRGLIFTSDTESIHSPVKANARHVSSSSPEEHEEEASGSAAPLLQQSATISTSPSSKMGMYDSKTYTFFAGDLNYRTSNTSPSKAQVSSFPQLNVPTSHEEHWHDLLQKDQLNLARSQGHVLHGMSESEITFGPTYKYKYHPKHPEQQYVIEEEDVESWSWASHRWPSWCDRILYSSSSPSASASASTKPLQPQSYTSLPMMTSSDHRPVVLSVLVPLRPIHNRAFESDKPVELDLVHWKSRRDAARRKEIVVGILSYLSLMREGQAMILGSLVAVIGGWLVVKGWTG